MAEAEESLRDPGCETGVEEDVQGEQQRLTAQWSVEDEEEAARERRRRERERQQRSQAEEGLNNCPASESGVLVQDSRFDSKPFGTSELEEDEGFSDWSQKLEQRKQRWAGEGEQEGEKMCHSEWRETQEAAPVHWEGRSPRHSCEEEDSSVREAESKLEQAHLNEESPTFIRFIPGPTKFLKFVPASFSHDEPEIEAELEDQRKLNEVMSTGEEIQDAAEEEEYVEEENEHGEKLEEKKRSWNEEEEEPEKRQRPPSISSVEEEYQPPLSPTTKITDRTESLNRSVQKSNSVKKTQPPLPVSKIDDKLEQYAHAVETSGKNPKPVRQLSIELPTNSAAVANAKSLWETGEVAAQTPAKGASCKDIVAGDITSVRSIWEQKDSPKVDGTAKVKLPGKKYKYVAVGHGQYKKVIDDEGPKGK